jgi:Phasin protein
MPDTNTVNAAMDPILDMVQSQLEASRQLADAVFAGTEKIDRMMIDATHRAFNEQVRLAQALVMARDPKVFTDLQSSLLSRPEAAANYQREMLQVFAQVQTDIGKSMQQYVEQIGVKTASNAASMRANAQKQGGDGGFNPVTGMLSVWESAFREVAALANRNMEAARSNLANAAGTMVETMAATAADESGEDRKGAGSRRK